MESRKGLPPLTNPYLQRLDHIDPVGFCFYFFLQLQDFLETGRIVGVLGGGGGVGTVGVRFASGDSGFVN